MRKAARRMVISLAGVVLLALLFACVTLYAQNGYHADVVAQSAAQVTVNRDSTFKTHAAKTNALVQQAIKIGAIKSTTPTYTSFIDTCRAYSVLTLFTMNHYQSCELRSVELYESTMNAVTTEYKLDPFLDNYGKSKFLCGYIASNGSLQLLYLDTNAPDARQSPDCKVPGFQPSSSFPEAITKTNENTTRSFESKSVDYSKQYLVVLYNEDYYFDKIGCSLPVFCKIPAGYPVIGD